MPRRPLYLAFVLVGLIAVGGCGSRSNLHPVEGEVVFPDGSRLDGGIVEFEAVAEESGQINARGAIGPDGKFRLTTYKDNDGALEGEHRALVIPPILTEEASRKGQKPAIDSKYRRYETSDLRFTVKPGLNKITITVTRPE
jgi:hypothetical protein